MLPCGLMLPWKQTYKSTPESPDIYVIERKGKDIEETIKLLQKIMNGRT
jgi:hypothetical protein